jgi:hypothetical protein
MKAFLLVVFAFALTDTFAQSSANVQMQGHPRLLVTKEDVVDLKQKIHHKDFSEIYTLFIAQKNFSTDGISKNGEPQEPIRQKIEALAFSYLLDTVNEKQSGIAAIDLINKYLNSISIATDYKQNAHAYQAVFTAALVYDWCYILLDSTTKISLINNMKKVSCLAEYCIFKNTPKQYLSGHYGEYAPTVYLAMGIAIYDEQQDVFDFAYNEQVQHFAPSRNPWYEASTHHQGSQYIHVRYGNELLQAFLLDKIGLHPYSSNIASATFRDLYANIPQEKDMDGMPEGDCHNNITMGDEYLEFLPIAATMSKDGFLQSYAKQNLNKLHALSTRALIFYNPFLPAKPLDSLPLSKLFPSPSGIMMARTKWDIDKKGGNSNTMVVLMNMKEYQAKNHTHLDIGHFGIYYKGHLALDAGIYQGKDENNGWGKLNYVNYYARTIAHNTLLIVDPNEPTPFEGSNVKAIARDGGQFSFKNKAWDSTQEMFNAGKTAQILASEISPGIAPDYSYLKGDMTASYIIPKNVANYPAKVDTVRRSFVFLNLKNEAIPGALIVLDKITSTNAGFKKTWLLHAQNEPNIKGDEVSFESTQNGRNGKLQNTVLLPEINNQQIEKVGGAGKEYWADGKNWGTVTQEDAGQWRIELSPKQQALSDNFLNVIQVMDAKPAKKGFNISKSLAIKGHYIAISISDRIVAQQLSLDKNEDEIAFTIGNKKSMYNVLITDLKAGEWLVNSETVKKTVTVNETSGTIYFMSKGGSFTLQKMR